MSCKSANLKCFCCGWPLGWREVPPDPSVFYCDDCCENGCGGVGGAPPHKGLTERHDCITGQTFIKLTKPMTIDELIASTSPEADPND